MSPAMAAAAAIAGHLYDVRRFEADAQQAETPIALSASADGPTSSPDEPQQEEPSLISDVQSNSAGAPADHVTTKATGLPKFTVLQGIAAPVDRSCVRQGFSMVHAHIAIQQYRHRSDHPGATSQDDSPYRPWQASVRGAALGPQRQSRSDLLHEPVRVQRRANSCRFRSQFWVRPHCGRKHSSFDKSSRCGSSREHAGWSLIDHGIRAVIAQSFGDIFKTNYEKNGSLAITLPADQIATLFDDAQHVRTLAVDLPKQVVRRENGDEYVFDIDPFRKGTLLPRSAHPG